MNEFAGHITTAELSAELIRAAAFRFITNSVLSASAGNLMALPLQSPQPSLMAHNLWGLERFLML